VGQLALNSAPNDAENSIGEKVAEWSGLVCQTVDFLWAPPWCPCQRGPRLGLSSPVNGRQWHNSRCGGAGCPGRKFIDFMSTRYPREVLTLPNTPTAIHAIHKQSDLWCARLWSCDWSMYGSRAQRHTLRER
jgi:hypothetical protein